MKITQLCPQEQNIEEERTSAVGMAEPAEEFAAGGEICRGKLTRRREENYEK